MQPGSRGWELDSWGRPPSRAAGWAWGWVSPLHTPEPPQMGQPARVHLGSVSGFSIPAPGQPFRGRFAGEARGCLGTLGSSRVVLLPPPFLPVWPE